MAKEIRIFFRDSTQWSQLLLLGVLVVVYVYNVKVLPLYSGEGVSFLLINVISFLNLGLAGFVVAAIAARFVFPAMSLEGRMMWLLRSSPLDVRALFWSKYWVGALPLLLVAVSLKAHFELVTAPATKTQVGVAVDQTRYDETTLAVERVFCGKFRRQFMLGTDPFDAFLAPYNGCIVKQAGIGLWAVRGAGGQLTDVPENRH